MICGVGAIVGLQPYSPTFDNSSHVVSHHKVRQKHNRAREFVIDLAQYLRRTNVYTRRSAKFDYLVPV
jgi:hypothetical protein